VKSKAKLTSLVFSGAVAGEWGEANEKTDQSWEI
jgi:hypothetical protein